MGFFKGIAQILLFLVNLIILLCAVALIAIGVIYKVNNAGLDLYSISSYAIAVGAIIALIAFFGCYGASSGSGCILTTYAVILFAIFIVQLVLAILAFVAIKNGDGELNTEVRKYLQPIYDNYYNNTGKRDIVDALQKNFDCCGINGPSDFNLTMPIMKSCCSSEITECSAANAYKTPCLGKLTEFLSDNAKILGGIAIGFAVFELLAAIFALWVRKRDRRYA